MKKSVFFGTLVAAGTLAGLASAATLDDVKARGELICGSNTGLTGFGAPDANGNWTRALTCDLCRAVAAAVLGDATKVQVRPHDRRNPLHRAAPRARSTCWSATRPGPSRAIPTSSSISSAVNYYDGQGFMVKKDLGVSSAKELDGATVCIQTGTTTELNLADFFKRTTSATQPVTVADDSEAQRQYLAGACDAYTTDASGLAASRATLPDAENHIILPEIISKEPLGPVVRHGDNNWGDVVRWTYYALVAAEEKGITSANVNEIAASTTNPEIKRLLGAAGDMGAMMGLDNGLGFKRAIAAVGNYGEIFARNIGEGTPIDLARGLNALWTQGGLQYAPPFR